MVPCQKMRIAIYHNLPSGGAKRVILGLTNQLTKRNHKVVLYTSNLGHKDLFFETQTQATKIVELNWLSPKSTRDYLNLIYFNYLNYLKNLARKIDGEDFDCIISGGDWITNTSLLSSFLETPCFHLAHEPKREFYQQTQAGRFKQIKQFPWKLITHKLKKWEIKSLNECKKVIVNSIFSSKVFEKLIEDRDKIKIIYPFLSKQFLKETKSTNRKNFYLAIGNNVYLKGLGFVINSISPITRSNRFFLKIVTSGSSKNYLQKVIGRKKIDNVEILTDVRDKKLINLYKKAKLLLYFPRKEPFGLVPLEALSLSCPVIAINEGGFTEVAKKSKNIKLFPRNKNLLKKKLLEYDKKISRSEDSFFKKMLKKKFNVGTYTKKILETIKNT